MTDTAAFLAGCAVTGVAAIFLLRNEFPISQAHSLQSPIVQPTVAAPVQPAPSASGMFQDPQQEWRFQTQLEQQQGTSRDLTDQFKRQETETQDLKSQLEKQQTQTEDLKSQLEKQQRSTEQMIAQIQEQQRIIEKMSDQSRINPVELQRNDSSEWQATILWIAGGVVMVILVGGGMIVIGVVVVLLTNRQKKTNRTIHVMHPIASPYNFAQQPQLLPPSRVRAKPPRQIDYYGE